eukprot:TRINITY_DN2181_c1_g1_i3.p1 TRINITY_DN2181_c1_g1~~TRINITY_DN2181_c1_g1_i3.p1  ORF type:complete len:610 (+),score=172.42 TRINITY_DN2181_c1_g1_i3:114-1943(+)
MGPKDWSHPDSMTLHEVDLQAFYSGTVTNVGQYGVFVNFGAEKDGLLKIPSKLGRRMKKGMELEGMTVISCDPDAGKVVMQIEEDQLPDLPPRQRRSQSAGASAGKSRARSTTPRKRKPRDWGHAEGTPLEELQEGDVLEGTVTNVSQYGVFVNIGAVKDARLNVNREVGSKFRIGDVVSECLLESIEVEAGRMSVGIPSLDEVVAGLAPKEKKPAVPKSKAKAKARAASPKPKAKPKAKGKARSASPPKLRGSGGVSIESLRVGTVVDGIVTNKNQYGVFVNIGCTKDAKLDVPARISKMFRKGDEVYGMTIDSVDLEKVQIQCSLEDPELSVDDETAKPTRSRSPANQGKGGRESSRSPSAANKVAPPAASKAKAKAKGKAKAKAQPEAPPQARGRASSVPVTSGRFKVGGFADGVVKNITPQGVFIDIGAAKDGVLKLPRAIAQQFEVGDEVHGMTIESLGSRNGAERITLSLEEPELDYSEPPPKKAPKASAKGKAKAKAKESAAPKATAKAAGKAKAAAAGGKNWSHADGLQLEELEEGAEVEGTVTNVNNYGVFVDIGCVKDGRLNIAKEQWKKFRRGDRIEGMVIEQVDVVGSKLGLGLDLA